MRITLARRRLAIYLAAVIVTAVGVFARTPFSLIAPGHALDLRDVITVAGHRPPATHYSMTDVGFIAHVSPFGLLSGLQPGWAIVRSVDYQPPTVDDVDYDRVMHAEMDRSQASAVYVAERAAGLAEKPAIVRITIVGIVPSSHARNVLRPGDVLLAIDGRSIHSDDTLQAALSRLRTGEGAIVEYARDGVRERATIDAIAVDGVPKLGVRLSEIVVLPRPPVEVRYDVGRVSGSSGGTMFALEIYRSFRPATTPATLRVAGTGTLDIDGNVGEIAGTMQKVIAAKRAGATLFLVPVSNYADVRSVRGIKIVPIRSFADAIRATDRV